jgi:hypothetical protein
MLFQEEMGNEDADNGFKVVYLRFIDFRLSLQPGVMIGFRFDHWLD